MMLLCIDTAGLSGGVGLLSDQGTLSRECWTESLKHSELLWPSIVSLLEKQRLAPRDLDAVAVVVGPGRLTGVRVGLSVAKAIGMSLQRPLIAVSTFEQIAAPWSSDAAGRTLCVLLALGTGRFALLDSGEIAYTDEPGLLTKLQHFDSPSPPLFCGSGALSLREEIESRWPGSIRADDPRNMPTLEGLAACAEAKFKRGAFTDASVIAPLYW
jgi:tRNA threonylcarbamoyl adenosine modification protein YeaZ